MNLERLIIISLKLNENSMFRNEGFLEFQQLLEIVS